MLVAAFSKMTSRSEVSFIEIPEDTKEPMEGKDDAILYRK